MKKLKEKIGASYFQLKKIEKFLQKEEKIQKFYFSHFYFKEMSEQAKAG